MIRMIRRAGIVFQRSEKIFGFNGCMVVDSFAFELSGNADVEY